MILRIFAFLILVLSIFVLHDRMITEKPSEFNALTRIDPLPIVKDMIKEKKYADADEYLTFFMHYKYVNSNPQAIKLLNQIREIRQSDQYKNQKILEGVISGKSDELSGQIAAGVSDLFLFGDIRDLTIESYHYLNDKEVDKVLVALSSIGVIASGMSIISGGSLVSLKPAISFVKFAQKSGKLPKWFGKHIIKIAKIAKNDKNLKPIKTLFADVYELINLAGLRGGIEILSKTSNLKSFKSSISFAKVFKKNSSTLFKIVGNDVVSIYKNMQNSVSKRVFLFASTYGKAGVKRLNNLGQTKFLKSLAKTKKLSRSTKIFNKNFDHYLQNIPNSVFYVIILVCIAILV